MVPQISLRDLKLFLCFRGWKSLSLTITSDINLEKRHLFVRYGQSLFFKLDALNTHIGTLTGQSHDDVKKNIAIFSYKH